MDCDKAIYRVYRYLDGELTVWRRWTIRRHLDECPPCAQGFDFEIELRQVVSAKCRDEVPPELRRRIAEALGRSRCRPERRRGPADGPCSDAARSAIYDRRRPDPEEPSREIGSRPRRLRRRPCRWSALTALAAPPARRRPVLADDKFKWFYWIGSVLAVEPRRSGCSRSASGTTSG